MLSSCRRASSDRPWPLASRAGFSERRIRCSSGPTCSRLSLERVRIAVRLAANRHDATPLFGVRLAIDQVQLAFLVADHLELFVAPQQVRRVAGLIARAADGVAIGEVVVVELAGA